LESEAEKAYLRRVRRGGKENERIRVRRMGMRGNFFMEKGNKLFLILETEKNT